MTIGSIRAMIGWTAITAIEAWNSDFQTWLRVTVEMRRISVNLKRNPHSHLVLFYFGQFRTPWQSNRTALIFLYSIIKGNPMLMKKYLGIIHVINFVSPYWEGFPLRSFTCLPRPIVQWSNLYGFSGSIATLRWEGVQRDGMVRDWASSVNECL